MSLHGLKIEAGTTFVLHCPTCGQELIKVEAHRIDPRPDEPRFTVAYFNREHVHQGCPSFAQQPAQNYEKQCGELTESVDKANEEIAVLRATLATVHDMTRGALIPDPDLTADDEARIDRAHERVMKFTQSTDPLHFAPVDKLVEDTEKILRELPDGPFTQATLKLRNTMLARLSGIINELADRAKVG